jgi:hypothetical protein
LGQDQIQGSTELGQDKDPGFDTIESGPDPGFDRIKSGPDPGFDETDQEIERASVSRLFEGISSFLSTLCMAASQDDESSIDYSCKHLWRSEMSIFCLNHR